MRKAYRTKFNEDPINKVYLGYDKMLVVVEGIKKGGGATPGKIIEGLNKVSGLQGTTGVITISPKTHQPVGLSMVMYYIDHGVYKDLGPPRLLDLCRRKPILLPHGNARPRRRQTSG